MTVRTMTNTVRRREVSENVRREVRVRRKRSRSRIEKDIGDSGDNNVERTVRTEEDSGSGKDTPFIHCETQCSAIHSETWCSWSSHTT